MVGPKTGYPRRVWVGVIAVLAVAYGLSNHWLHAGVNRVPISEHTPGALPMSSGQVPDAVQNAVIAKLGNVLKTEELAFFPLAGQRVGVYATVNLGYHTQLTDQDMLIVQRDINAWFTDVYKGEPSVADAEIYFLLDGRTVGGAGLGMTAYRALAIKSSTGAAGTLVVSLKQGAQITGEGTDESWYEIQS